MKKAKASIRGKLRRIMFLLIFIELIISLSINLITDISNTKTRLQSQSKLYAELVSEYCVVPMTFKDSIATQENISKIKIIPKIVAVAVYNSDNILFSKYTKNADFIVPLNINKIDVFRTLKSAFIVQQQAIKYENENLGTVFIFISNSEIKEAIMYDIRWSLMVSLLIAIIGILLIEIFQRRISNPIIELLETVNKIRKNNDLSIRTLSTSTDEIGELSSQFNEMLEQIQKQDSEQKKSQEKIQLLNAELEERVAKRTQQLELSNKDLEAFAYSVSHDLRTPLRHIDGFTKLLETKITDKNEATQHYFDKIHESSNNMQLLISDLLTYSRIGRQELHIDLVDLNIILNEIIATYEQEIQNRKIEWNIAKLPKLQVDAILFKTVFDNLISNALKYTSLNDVTKIEVGYKESKDSISIYFKDNGVGFDQQYVSKLFGVFQRLHTEKEFQGTGIGLANVKRIVQKHGGEVKAEGELNKGATFSIILPK